MIKGRRILITGGAGFIGTALSKLLVKNNQVLVYDSLNRSSPAGTGLAGDPAFRLIAGNVLDFNLVRMVVAEYRPHIIIHLAAVAGIDTVVKSPSTTMKVNLVGTYNVLEAVRPFIRDIERFVIFSTSEVFGSYSYKSEESHSTNLAPVGEARWTYSVSKLGAEHLTFSHFKEFGLPAVIIRPFNVYGPGQVGEGAIHVFVKNAINNRQIQIHGDGDQIRSWCYVDDMLQGIMLALIKNKAVGQVFNIGNPEGTITIKSLAEKIVLLSGSKSEIIHVPKHYVDVELRIPNIQKAKEILDYRPACTLNEGLLKTIQWYRTQELSGEVRREKHENIGDGV